MKKHRVPSISLTRMLLLLALVLFIIFFFSKMKREGMYTTPSFTTPLQTVRNYIIPSNTQPWPTIYTSPTKPRLKSPTKPRPTKDNVVFTGLWLRPIPRPT